ncbi:MAG: NUDIX domain-containing protein [Thermomicrobiales bacterium]|nr:NUDIX domain-containing protein [Thermomicrobiales bacterium]
MSRIVADIVDAYLFRKIHARVQFLLLLRRPDAPLGNTWQAVHDKMAPDETALDAAERAVRAATGVTPTHAYSADFINQVYDHTRDAVVLAPVFAFAAPPRASIDLGAEFTDYAWCEREEAIARLLWSGQRWAVRHIDEVIGHGGPDAEFYRLR